MPTNEQRRETAKRKLERQLERREAQARKRRIFTIIGATLAVVAVIGARKATRVRRPVRIPAVGALTSADSLVDEAGRRWF